MKSIYVFLSVIILSFKAFAADHKSLQCETETYKLTTYQSPTAPDEVVILVQENETGIYSEVFTEHHEEKPVPVWIFRQLNKATNVLNVVSTDEVDSAVADVSVDMGEFGVLKAFGIPCQLNIYKVE